MRRIIIAAAAMLAILTYALTRPRAMALPPAAVAAQPGFGSSLWVPWAFGGCVLDIFAAAAVANWRDHRELTYPEAYTCGVLFWFEHPMLRKKHP